MPYFIGGASIPRATIGLMMLVGVCLTLTHDVPRGPDAVAQRAPPAWQQAGDPLVLSAA